MRKEVVVAIIIGGVLGLTVAFGIWKANSSFSASKQVQSSSTSAPLASSFASPEPVTDKNLTLTSPNQYEVFTQSTIKIAGLTKANSYVVIQSDKNTVTRADSSGSFSVDFELEEGINAILIKSFEQDYTAHEKSVTVVYEPNLSDSSNSSDEEASEESVRDKVQQQLQDVSNKPQAIIGTVTDKTQNGFNVRNGSSELKLVSIDTKQTLFIKSGQTTKSLPFSDLAIGDYVAAIGYQTSNSALEANRVLISSITNTQNYRIFLGKVTKATTRQIDMDILAGLDQQNFSVTGFANVDFYSMAVDNTISTIKSSAVKADMVAIVIGTNTNNGISIDSLYAIAAQ